MDPPPSFQQLQQRSPFLSDIDSLPQSDQHHSSSPFTPFADFNTAATLDDPLVLPANASDSTTPFTSSFAAEAGSYHNSPLGSDISYIPGNDFSQHSPNPSSFSAGGFDISVLPPDFAGDDYDPSSYDATDSNALFFGNEFMASLNEQANNQSKSQNQSSSPSLSTSSLGSNNHGVSVSVTPALDHPMGSYGSPYDHGSPASSSGGDNNDYQFNQQQSDITRSRGSSISSQPEFPASTTLGLESVHLDTSSNPSQGHSSSWATKGLGQGAQTPPQIFIPGQTSSASPHPSPSPSNRTLAPDNAGSVLPPGGIGMGIQIVPATPISAGVGQHGPFQNVDLLNQGRDTASNAQAQQWGGQTCLQQSFGPQSRGSRGTSPLPRLPQAPPSQYSFPPNAALTPPPSGGTSSLSLTGNGGPAVGAMGALHLSRDNSPERGTSAADGNFLIPISNPRLRSKSETSLRPQFWQMGVTTGYDGQSQNQGQTSGLQMDGTSYEQQQLPRLNAPHMAASFGPPVTGSTGFDDTNASNIGTTSPNNNFLTPDFALGASDLRRARSESQGHHRRNALSADMTPIFADRSGLANQSPFYSPSTNLSGRPSDSFLSPGQTAGLPGVNISGGGLGLMGAGGGHRRSLSHGGSGHSHSRSLSRERVSLSTSPYPSPHASPRVNTNELLPDTYPYPSTSSSYGQTGTSGQNINGSTPTVHVMSHDAQGRPTVQTQAPISVVRQNVTTHATADASQRRRRTEANFVCPVPGCGSTFTRHFNLKGHMRSHNEERPFKCKWPGCDKGFARQHDCKRHEQLHLNIRPYTCQGCKRTFARMDALNRHLRSDAGTDCQALQPILTSDTPNNPAMSGDASDSTNGNENGAITGTLTLKSESDPTWQSSTATGVMV